MNTPITYSALPLEFYPHNDWFETLASLKEVVRTQRFDIALFGEGLLDLCWCGLQRLTSLGTPRLDEVQESHDRLSPCWYYLLSRPPAHPSL